MENGAVQYAVRELKATRKILNTNATATQAFRIKQYTG